MLKLFCAKTVVDLCRSLYSTLQTVVLCPNFNLMLWRNSLICFYLFPFDDDLLHTLYVTSDLVLVYSCLCSPECDGGGDSQCLQTSMPEAQLQTNPKSAQTDTGKHTSGNSLNIRSSPLRSHKALHSHLGHLFPIKRQYLLCNIWLPYYMYLCCFYVK